VWPRVARRWLPTWLLTRGTGLEKAAVRETDAVWSPTLARLVAETAGAMIGASIGLLPDEPPSQNGNGV
jgi:hypothetical protein